jgi:uncharacterized protein (DUF433 family)
MNWEKHIHSDESILLGKPVIRGTRISVELILELYESGWSTEMILDSYPNVTLEDLKAVFAYLRDCVQHELFFPISKAS